MAMKNGIKIQRPRAPQSIDVQLYGVAMSGDEGKCRALLDQGVDPESKEWRFPEGAPLHAAASHGQASFDPALSACVPTRAMRGTPTPPGPDDGSGSSTSRK